MHHLQCLDRIESHSKQHKSEPSMCSGIKEGDKVNKEVDFFNIWPLPTAEDKSFLSYFPDAGSIPEGSTLIDGTPLYLRTAMAAPRIQAMVPHAKFVVVLRVCAQSFLRMSLKSKERQFHAQPVLNLHDANPFHLLICSSTCEPCCQPKFR